MFNKQNSVPTSQETVSLHPKDQAVNVLQANMKLFLYLIKHWECRYSSDVVHFGTRWR
jgi:hypothetical protein